MKTAEHKQLGKASWGERFIKSFRKYWLFYAFAIPGLIYFLIFKYFK